MVEIKQLVGVLIIIGGLLQNGAIWVFIPFPYGMVIGIAITIPVIWIGIKLIRKKKKTTPP